MCRVLVTGDVYGPRYWRCVGSSLLEMCRVLVTGDVYGPRYWRCVWGWIVCNSNEMLNQIGSICVRGCAVCDVNILCI